MVTDCRSPRVLRPKSAENPAPSILDDRHCGDRTVPRCCAARNVWLRSVLASWAIPKGPSMNPADKRLAIRTEDHPLQYAKFEGVIPSGQYGAGTVMVWDLGNYQLMEKQPPEEQLASGKIHTLLLGEKLRGGFSLVQLQRRSMNSSRRDHWLLIKSRDEYADPSWDIESV